MESSLIKIVQSLEQEAERLIQAAIARSIEEKAATAKDTEALIRELETKAQQEAGRIRATAYEALQRELSELKQKFDSDLEQVVKKADKKLPDSIQIILQRLKGG